MQFTHCSRSQRSFGQRGGNSACRRARSGAVALTEGENAATVDTMSLPPQYDPQTEAVPSQPAPGASYSDLMPAPGDLQIKGRRSWATWQLAVVFLVAVLVGFALNGTTQSSSTASTTAPAYQVPASTGATTTTVAGSGGTTTTVAAGGTTTTAAGGTTTTVAGGTTTTVAGGSTTATTAAPAPAGVLLPATQKQGNWSSPPFTTTAAGWNIGWAFSCTPAPASGPSFQVFVTPSGSAPAGSPAVSGTGASGQSVTAQSSLGAQTLVVEAPATCEWVVKVTGS